tara:strand:- start:18436 stop:19788 length:1353 start_codon:yes stop_codon:yes gene_type:complete
MTAIDHVYDYALPSVLATGANPHLQLSTSGGEAPHPFFFVGRLTQPKRTASAMLTLSRIARSRFHIPAAMLARLIREADPVVTCSAARLRMESFSACCGVYARLDLLPEAIDGEMVGKGTTNVDFNAAMRAELAKVVDRDGLRLSVGRKEVRAQRGAHPEVCERKVPLPLRWFKGFLAAQAIQAKMTLAIDVPGAEGRRFLRTIPTESPPGSLWVAGAGRGLRITTRAGARAVQVGGIARVRVLDDLIRHAKRLRVYASEAGYSAWELDLGEARFTLLLSAETWRGFSGEGIALSEMATSSWAERIPHLRAALAWQSSILASEIAKAAGVSANEAKSALAALGARGLVGFDLADGAYFHRELPFDMERIDAVHPRLTNARKLVASAGVTEVVRTGEDVAEAKVRGSGVLHTVHIDGDDARCTCPWFSQHRGQRGPCKHVLALQLVIDSER